MPPRSQKSREYGTSGNLDVNGYVGDDYLTELDGHDGRATFDRMRRSDPIIALTLDVLSLPLRKATYRIEPASDDPVDVDIAAFIQSQLIDGYSKDGLTWDDVLKHALLMLPFGFSILEILWALRDGLWTLDGLAPRLPQSIVRWQFGGERGRHLIGPIQQDSQGNDTTLPVEKLLIFTRDREGDNYEESAFYVVSTSLGLSKRTRKRSTLSGSTVLAPVFRLCTSPHGLRKGPPNGPRRRNCLKTSQLTRSAM